MDSIIFYIVSLIIGFGSVIVVDTAGLLWMTKKIRTEGLLSVGNIGEKLVWLGWSGLVLSGLGLITFKGYVDNLTVIKLFFVLMLGINGIFLYFLKKRLENVVGGIDLRPIDYWRTGVTSFISQLGWWGAIFIGFVHRHIEHNIPWPNNPYIWILLIFTSILFIWLLGELILAPKNKVERLEGQQI
jgi:hypothetical protein